MVDGLFEPASPACFKHFMQITSIIPEKFSRTARQQTLNHCADLSNAQSYFRVTKLRRPSPLPAPRCHLTLRFKSGARESTAKSPCNAAAYAAVQEPGRTEQQRRDVIFQRGS